MIVSRTKTDRVVGLLAMLGALVVVCGLQTIQAQGTNGESLTSDGRSDQSVNDDAEQEQNFLFHLLTDETLTHDDDDDEQQPTGILNNENGGHLMAVDIEDADDDDGGTGFDLASSETDRKNYDDRIDADAFDDPDLSDADEAPTATVKRVRREAEADSEVPHLRRTTEPTPTATFPPPPPDSDTPGVPTPDPTRRPKGRKQKNGRKGKGRKKVLGDRPQSDAPINESVEKVEPVEREPKTCEELRCANGGVCVVDATRGGVRCRCPLGTTGTYCERDAVVRYPHFASTGYVAFPMPKTSHKNLDVLIEFRPDSPEGLLMFNADDPGARFDFLAITLHKGRVEFRFDLGFGLGQIRTKNSVMLGQWNMLHFHRNSWNAYIQLNGGPVAKGKSELFGWTYNKNSYGSYQWNYVLNKVRASDNDVKQFDGRQLSGKYNDISVIDPPAVRVSSLVGQKGYLATTMFRQNLFIGGYPLTTFLANRTGSAAGFVGCVRHLEISGKLYDMRKGAFVGDALFGIDVDDCGANACNNLKCENEAQCAVVGADTPICMCPLGTGGRVCQAKIEVLVPSFAERSYLQYVGLRRTVMVFVDVTIVFRPDGPDGILLYNGYAADGTGDFLAVALSNGTVELRYDLGTGSAVIRSAEQVSLHEWHTVRLSRQGRNGRIQVDDQPAVEGSSKGAFTQLTLALDLFVGGHPNFDEVSKMAGGRQGFSGCIQKLTINDRTFKLIDEAVSGMNVNNCNHPCTSQPPVCLNGGHCQPEMDKYQCECAPAFSGDNCEDKAARYRYRYRYLHL